MHPRTAIGTTLALATALVLALVLTAASLASAPASQVLRSGPLAEPADTMTAARALADGSAPTGLDLAAALEQARLVADTTAEVAPETAGLDWAMVGPTNIGGRLTDIAVGDGAVYAATANGGVWRSTDGGDTFEPAWPDDLTQAIGALAITPSGTLLAGTGELNPGGGSITFGGTGMYRSTDGGDTWALVGLEESGTFGRIMADDEGTIWAAAGGNLFVPGGDRGLYRSTDDGQTWELALAPANDTTGGADIAIDPTDSAVVYVSMWDHLRTPGDRIYGGTGSGLYRTFDGGETWSAVTGIPGPGDAAVGRIGVAVGGDPIPLAINVNGAAVGQNVYVSVIHTDGRPSEGDAGFYRSVDGGRTFVEIPSPLFETSQSSFGWWFGRIFVDPANPLHIFVPGVQLLESQDGGLTFATSAGVHADQHIVVWDPYQTGVAYLGNDGGFYRSDANGAAWTKASYEPWTQLYTLDVSDQFPDRIVAGLQDNGCVRNYGADRVGTVDAWNSYGCGDGLETLINPEDANIVFGCSQYGSCSRSTNAGDSSSSIGSTTSSIRNWLTPLEFDPVDPSVMYYAGNILNRSTTGGAGGWTAISDDLTRGVKEDRDYPFGTISAVGLATDGATIYTGSDDGLVYRTTDLGASWDLLLDQPVYVTRITVDPTDADTAFIAFSGFRSGDESARVSLTTDGGETFTNISGNLPAAPVNDLLLADDAVVVGTDVGVYLATSVNGEDTEWLRVGDNLPQSPVMDLDWHPGTRSLTAATFGRSAWRLTLPGVLGQ